jgi:glycosyltransferase involved in cell wall biosynthesis
MFYALVAYPLSSQYRRQFEESIGSAPRYLQISELRRQSLTQMIRALRGLRAERLFLPIEHVESNAILPVLELVASIATAERIEVVSPTLKRAQVSRLRAFSSLTRLLAASVASGWGALRSRVELGKLMRTERMLPNTSREHRALYLKTNLWYGVKAGGSVGHIAGVVDALASHGYEVDFAATEAPETAKAYNFIGIRPPTSLGLPSELNYYRFHHSFVEQARKLIFNKRYSFLYQRMSLANYAGVTLSRIAKIPLILEYNGSEAWIAKHWGKPLKSHALAVLAEDACLKHAHLVVTVSGVLRSELLERGVSPERVVCYPNCIDPRVFNPQRFSNSARATCRTHLQVAQDATMVTFVGTFGRWHGAEILAQAVRRLDEEKQGWIRENKVHVVFVGDGLMMPRVRELLPKGQGNGLYTFAGLVPQAEAPAYLAASDILVSPHVPNADGSRFFGSPTKLFEYMAMGKGIVASELEQIGEVLRPALRSSHLPEGPPGPKDHELAVLVEPGNVESLMEGVRFLVEQKDWRETLGNNARAEALSKYTWKHHVNAILEGLEKVCPSQ